MYPYNVIRMARTTTDPKPHTVALRLNESDYRVLKRLAKRGKCSRTEVLRRMLRAAKEG